MGKDNFLKIGGLIIPLKEPFEDIQELLRGTFKKDIPLDELSALTFGFMVYGKGVRRGIQAERERLNKALSEIEGLAEYMESIQKIIFALSPGKGNA